MTEAVTKAIEAAGGSVTFALGDLTTGEGADAVHAAARSRTCRHPREQRGRLRSEHSWTSSSASDWADICNTNVLTSVRTIQRFVPAMREQGWGRVIQISSITGERAGRLAAPLRGVQRSAQLPRQVPRRGDVAGLRAGEEGDEK
nr:SDR family NAD(P)-dependent oxidoreductase [Streptomyces sabulosicollis]